VTLFLSDPLTAFVDTPGKELGRELVEAPDIDLAVFGPRGTVLFLPSVEFPSPRFGVRVENELQEIFVEVADGSLHGNVDELLSRLTPTRATG